MSKRLHLPWAPRYGHQELVQRASVWLKNTQRCKVVFDVPTVLTSEIPDAIGWCGDGDGESELIGLNAGAESFLIECKATLSDFRRDSLKAHRNTVGMGNSRFYLAPIGVIPAGELPSGWGLLEAGPTRITVVVGALRRTDKDWVSEMRLLVRAASK